MKEEWINWDGGECPVHKDSVVDVVLADGYLMSKYKAGNMRWHREHDSSDITRYRVVTKAKDTSAIADNPMKIYCDNFLALSKALEDAGGNSLTILQKNHEFLETIARNSVKIDAEYLGGKV